MKSALFIPNFGTFGHPRTVATFAREAEAAGWHGLFIWDHVNRPTEHPVVDPWVALSAAAMATNKLTLGTGITPIPRRRPWKLAREVTSLAQLNSGRVVLGVGIGSSRPMEWDDLGEETNTRTRGAMLDEALEVLQGLWSGERYSFDGKHYQVDDVRFLPPIGAPIWVGGSWPNKAPMRRAARWDGVFPHLDGGPEERIENLEAALAFIRSHRERTTPFDVVYLDTSPAGTPPEQQGVWARMAEEIGATWYFENLAPWRYGTAWESLTWPGDAMLARVRLGPPCAS